MLNRRYLRDVPLPEDLTSEDIFLALQNTQNFFTMIRENASINLSTIIQANNFSGIVSNVFTKKLSDISKYHTYHDQKYPDLMHESKQIGLEVKASNKPLKGGEGHNGHSGWHIVVCYHILENGDIEFIQVEIADLVGYECHNPDWKYQGSQRNSNNSQRTETYITTNIGTAKLRDGTVYLNPDHVTITPALLRFRKKIAEIFPIPVFSPFAD
ncbi:hypothetical protein [Bilophila wadsworthia]|jgi:hypothetical protein|uniref:hypothetical protein n=1 Tax=Bilophila wadsworthia TaxID=35833 RepID=UPI0026DBE15F|nr:hypothetical protein [Bilophila wadsworthia]